METPQAVTSNGIIALTLLTCVAPVLIIVLAALWFGPARWPLFVRKSWESVLPEERQRAIVLRIITTPLTWLLVGIIVGSSLINPLARWLRMLLP